MFCASALIQEICSNVFSFNILWIAFVAPPNSSARSKRLSGEHVASNGVHWPFFSTVLLIQLLRVSTSVPWQFLWDCDAWLPEVILLVLGATRRQYTRKKTPAFVPDAKMPHQSRTVADGSDVNGQQRWLATPQRAANEYDQNIIALVISGKACHDIRVTGFWFFTLRFLARRRSITFYVRPFRIVSCFLLWSPSSPLSRGNMAKATAMIRL
jgi:hypothetical protein